MWYRLDENSGRYIQRVKDYCVAWYDMTKNGDCFDERHFHSEELNKAITYVETVEDKNNQDRSRVFVRFDNGNVYEVKFEKIDDFNRCSNFYD